MAQLLTMCSRGQRGSTWIRKGRVGRTESLGRSGSFDGKLKYASAKAFLLVRFHILVARR